MEKRQLGNSGLSVSKVCLGTMTYGEQNTESEAHAQLDYATASGVNFIDAAEMYPVPVRAQTYGATERIVGNWLGQRAGNDAILVVDYGLGADPVAGYHCGDGSQPFPVKQISCGLEVAAHCHFSMNTLMVPPQVSPTSKASSSAMP